MLIIIWKHNIWTVNVVNKHVAYRGRTTGRLDMFVYHIFGSCLYLSFSSGFLPCFYLFLCLVTAGLLTTTRYPRLNDRYANRFIFIHFFLWCLRGGKTGVSGGEKKPLGGRKKTIKKLDPHLTPRLRATVERGKCSDTAPFRLPLLSTGFKYMLLFFVLICLKRLLHQNMMKNLTRQTIESFRLRLQHVLLWYNYYLCCVTDRYLSFPAPDSFNK